MVSISYRQRQKGLKIGQAPIGKYIRHIRKTFKEEADLDLSTAEASEIVDRLQRNLERGGTRATGDVGAKAPYPRVVTDPSVTGTRFAKRGELESPGRRKFMQQAAGAVAGIAADPRMILEPATPEAIELSLIHI